MTEFATPRPAASVILCRQGDEGIEVYLVKRHGRAGFMANAHVFPGGITENGDLGSLKRTAARELFEEAGVLLGDPIPDPEELCSWRQKLVDDDAELDQFCAETGTEIREDALHYFAQWITPSHEKRRYMATFFLAVMPDGQTPSADQRETVSGRWVSVRQAGTLAGELELPPPQLRTFYDMRDASTLDDLFALCEQCAKSPLQILPRVAPTLPPITLLLPWDPHYAELGAGEARAVDREHPLATGPSRVMLQNGAWQLGSAND